MLHVWDALNVMQDKKSVLISVVRTEIRRLERHEGEITALICYGKQTSEVAAPRLAEIRKDRLRYRKMESRLQEQLDGIDRLLDSQEIPEFFTHEIHALCESVS